MSNAAVSLRCANGLSYSTQAATNGAWGISVPEGAAPCLVQALDADGQRWHSILSASGTVGITPITELVTARVLRANPSDAFAAFDQGMAAKLSASGIATAQTEVKRLASGWLELGAFNDLIATPFAVGDAVDRALEAAAASAQDKGTTLRGLAKPLAASSDIDALRSGILAKSPQALSGVRFGQAGASLRLPTGLPLGKATVIDGTILLRTEMGLLVSRDRGSNWTVVPIRASAEPVKALGQWLVASGTDVYASTDGGVSWALRAQLPMLGHDASGTAGLVDITDLYLAANGRLYAMSSYCRPSDNGCSSLGGLRAASTTNGRDWLSEAAIQTALDSPRRESLGACKGLILGYTAAPLLTGTGLVLEPDDAGGSSVALYDGTSGANCRKVGTFATGLAPALFSAVGNSSLLMAVGRDTRVGPPWGYATSADGQSWATWAGPTSRYLEPVGFARLDADTLLTTGTYLSRSNWYNVQEAFLDTPVLQASAIDGSKPRDLLPGVRRNISSVVGSGQVLVAAAGGVWTPTVKSGALLVSSDLGNTWSERFINQVPRLAAVAVSDAGQFVAVGAGGTIVLGDKTGQSWELVASPSSQDLVQVAWGKGQYLAVASSGDLLLSVDGRNWTPKPAPFGSRPKGYWPAIGDLRYFDGRFVLAASDYFETSEYPAASGLWESGDGQAWTRVSSERGWTSVFPCDGAMVAVGWADIAVKPSQTASWRFDKLPSGAGFGRAAGCGQGTLMVLTGTSPYDPGSATDRALVSTDLGRSWHLGAIPFGALASKLSHQAGRWYISGDRDMLWVLP